MANKIKGRDGNDNIIWEHDCVFCGGRLPPVNSEIVICGKCGAKHEIIDKK